MRQAEPGVVREPLRPLEALRRGALDDRARYVFAGLFTLSLVLIGLAVWILAAAPSTEASTGARGATSRLVMVVLLANLVPLAMVATIIGVRVLSLVRERASDAGARLHLRFVTLLSLIHI
mgnify:CR=1 FL=1